MTLGVMTLRIMALSIMENHYNDTQRNETQFYCTTEYAGMMSVVLYKLYKTTLIIT
jgi:hypothetical protein